jgi:hypothetical protein
MNCLSSVVKGANKPDERRANRAIHPGGEDTYRSSADYMGSS